MSGIKQLLDQAANYASAYSAYQTNPYAYTQSPQLQSFEDPRFAGQKVEEIAQLLLQALQQTNNPKINLRQSYVIDPVEAAGALSRGKPGSLQYQADQMAAKVFLLEQMLAEQGMQRFNRGEGSIPDAFGLRVSPDVIYKRQIKGQTNNPSNLTPVEFTTFAKTPMMDWDFPDPSHPDASVTVRNLGDVEEVIREYQRDVPESNIRLYQTPGGYRAFEFGQEVPVTQFQEAYRQMNVDPLYARFNMHGSRVGEVFDKPGFRARVSHKPGRTDWVALPIAQFQGSDPQLSQRSRQIVEVMHDEPIKRAYLSNPQTMKAATQAVQSYLPSASASLQAAISRRLGL